MVKFRIIDNSTIQASSKEVDRVYSSFRERISLFCKRYDVKLEATIILNPNLVEFNNIIRLKDNVYCYLNQDVKKQLSDTQCNDLIQKLRFFTFDNNGINNLLFLLGEYQNKKEFVLENSNDTTYLVEKLYQTPDVINSIVSYVAIEKRRNQRSMVCVFGDAYSGKTTCALSIANSLNRKVQIIGNTELLKLKQNLAQKLFEEDNNNVIIFENVDYLFSDLKGNMLSIDLVAIRESIIRYWEKSKNIIVFTLKSIETVPRSFTNRFSLILGLDRPNISIRRRIAKENLMSDKLVDLLSKEINFCSIGRYVDIVKDIKQLQVTFGEDWLRYWKYIEYIKTSQLVLNKPVDVDYTLEVPSISLDDVVLPEESKNLLKVALTAILKRDYLINTIGWNEIDSNVRSIINFFGPPGTGKTMTAKAIAAYMSEQTGNQYELMSLNYSEIESKYVGDAPKKLEKAFNYARDKNVIMFFDEADSFLGKRISNVEHGADQAINSLRSTMLIQLEKFTGIVIFATNLTCNYDKAFKTRFLAEIEFKMPDQYTLSKIFKANLPSKLIKNSSLWDCCLNDKDFEKMSELAVGLSGRDIRNINERVILKNLSDKFSLQMFLSEISLYKEEKKAEIDFSKKKQSLKSDDLPKDVEDALIKAQPVVNEDCEKLKKKILC